MCPGLGTSTSEMEIGTLSPAPSPGTAMPRQELVGVLLFPPCSLHLLPEIDDQVTQIFGE